MERYFYDSRTISQSPLFVTLSSGTMKAPLLNMRDTFWDSHSVFGCEPCHLLTFVTDSETWAFKKMDDKFKC